MFISYICMGDNFAYLCIHIILKIGILSDCIAYIELCRDTGMCINI